MPVMKHRPLTPSFTAPACKISGLTRKVLIHTPANGISDGLVSNKSTFSIVHFDRTESFSSQSTCSCEGREKGLNEFKSGAFIGRFH